uniref:Uncharacterized protein n=1 Tax=Moniliophthora roreri TaxID=221103 RepID=A0A0W0GCS8_MONRR
MADISPTTAMKVKKPNDNRLHRVIHPPLIVGLVGCHPNPTSHRSDDGGSSDPLGALFDFVETSN